MGFRERQHSARNHSQGVHSRLERGKEVCNRITSAQTNLKRLSQVADALGDPDITAQECKRRWKLILKVSTNAISFFNPSPSSNSSPQANRNCGPWTPSEDRELLLLVQEVQRSGQKRHSKHIQWADIAAKMFWRDGKQCRERWCNQLDPEIVHRRLCIRLGNVSLSL